MLPEVHSNLGSNPVLVVPMDLDPPPTEAPTPVLNDLRLAPSDFVKPPTEDEKLEGYYQYARDWLQVPDNRNLTLEEFYEFVGGLPKRRLLITKYFLLNPEAEFHKDNINVELFKTFIRIICNETMSNPAFILRERVTLIEAQRHVKTTKKWIVEN